MSRTEKTTIGTLRARKREGQKFSVITCYDHPTAHMQQEAGIDSILVGDTLGEVLLGHESNLPVKMDFIITLTEAVRRGAPLVFLIGDMPYLSYQVTIEEAIRNAGRFVVEARCDSVKLEVDRRHLDVIEALTRANIPVMAHLGLRPQAIAQTGKYRAVGRHADEAVELVRLAKECEMLGAHALLLEGVPAEVAKEITERTKLPVIGIAAGPHTDAQVLVMHDILGIRAGHTPSSVKPWADIQAAMTDTFRRYHDDVVAARFPDAADNIPMAKGQLDEFTRQIRSG